MHKLLILLAGLINFARFHNRRFGVFYKNQSGPPGPPFRTGSLAYYSQVRGYGNVHNFIFHPHNRVTFIYLMDNSKKSGGGGDPAVKSCKRVASTVCRDNLRIKSHPWVA